MTDITLLPHQRPVFQYAKTRDRIALFLEMRVGKTYVTMKWIREKGARRILLLAPWNTLVGTRNWEGHLRRHGETVTMLCNMPTEDREAAARWKWERGIVEAPEGYDDLFARAGDTVRGLVRRKAEGWFLLHFEGLRVAPDLLDWPWDAIIVDESTRIRNPQAQITKTLLNRGEADLRAILSGLPNPESPMDFFTQFQFTLGHCMGYTNFWAWRHRYFSAGAFAGQWYPKKGTLDAIKAFVHQNSFILTRAKAGIGSKKSYEMRSVPMGPKQMRALKQVAKSYEYEGTETKWAPVKETWMQKIAGGFSPTEDGVLLDDGKPRLLHEVLTEELPRESVVVWFRFNQEIDYCWEYLTRKKVKVERVHGGLKMPKSERSVIQDRFQDGHTRVLLMQVALGQFGWDLSRANYELYYSNTYEHEDRRQSEDRIIHPQKRDPVTVIDLVTIGTSDEDVVEALQSKQIDSKRFSQAMAASVAARLAKITRLSPGEVA
jgi:hypothetical protein